MKEQNEKIRLFLVDDHLVIRESFISLFRDYPHLEVVGHAGDGAEALKMLSDVNADIVLTDLSMPGMDGYDLLTNIQRDFPRLKVIVLSMYYNDRTSSELILRGANSALPKECSSEDLIETINKVYQEGYYFNPNVAKRIVKESLKRPDLNLKEEFTSREMEIIELICQEYTNKKIALMLELNEGTVEFHKRKIFGKTETKTTVGLLKYAIKNGLLSNY